MMAIPLWAGVDAFLSGTGDDGSGIRDRWSVIRLSAGHPLPRHHDRLQYQLHILSHLKPPLLFSYNSI